MATEETPFIGSRTYEAELHEKAATALSGGSYTEAFRNYQLAVLNSVLRVFRDGGVRFAKPAPEVTATELAVGVVMAAQAELEERGDDAPLGMSSATWMLAAMADLRAFLESPSQSDEGDRLAGLMMRAIMVGQMEMQFSMIDRGFVQAFASQELLAERRRQGAAKTNAKKASVRDDGLAEALRITGKNPTLSNEEVAIKIRESLPTAPTVKTLTLWVRNWRRENLIPAVKKL